jgi:PAS domain S-box-containing protein/diguanylate cyclase (GGDEF)-like protein
MLGLHDPEIFRIVLDSIQTGVYLVGRDGKILFWNNGAEQITGYRSQDVLGHGCRDNILAHCNERDCAHCGAACPIISAIHDGRASEVQMFFQHRSGHRLPVRVRAVPIRDRQGSVIGAAECFDEHTFLQERASYQNNLAAHGCLDLSTGAMNHAFTLSHLRENVAFFNEYHLPFGVVTLRVDQLPEFSAAHGREAAGALLHVVAQTVKHVLGAAGFLGRWTEDQFLVIVPNSSPPEVERIAVNLQKIASSSGIQWWGDFLSISATIGMALMAPGDTVESLFDRAHGAVNPVPDASNDSSAPLPAYDSPGSES